MENISVVNLNLQLYLQETGGMYNEQNSQGCYLPPGSTNSIMALPLIIYTCCYGSGRRLLPSGEHLARLQHTSSG
jgi:hypothetical protein